MAHSDFATESGGYDPNEIVTKSQDHHGHSTNQRVHIPPTWRAMIEQLIQSAEWTEYDTVQAFVRDAIYHRLQWAADHPDRSSHPEIKRAMIRERYSKRLGETAELEKAMRVFRNDIDSALSEMLQREEYESVIGYVEDLMQDIESFQGPEQEKLINQLHTYLERAKGRW